MMKVYLYIFVMALVTYLIRMIPFVFVKGKIKNRFLKSFLYYVPYAVLAAMTIPAIFYSTGSLATATLGFLVALGLAYFEMPLIIVALASALAALLSGLIF